MKENQQISRKIEPENNILPHFTFHNLDWANKTIHSCVNKQKVVAKYFGREIVKMMAQIW